MVAELTQSDYPGRWWMMLPDGPHRVPVVSAVLQTQRRPARSLFRSATRGRSNGAHHLWQEQRVLCRSDREETAKPFSAGDERPLVWHRWMQSRLPILSELGHLQSARVGQT